jgi:hypothetical protein
MQAGGVDQQTAAHGHGIGATDVDLYATPGDASTEHRTEEHWYGAGVLGVAL